MVRVLLFKMNLILFKKEFCSVYMFFLTLLNAVVNTHMTVGDNSHAFIQANSNDVRFIGVPDGLEVLMHQDLHISNLHEDLRLDDDAFATSTYLKFVPPQLDFKERHIGVPHQEKVTLVNTDPNRTIHLTSISGNTLHFHSSFFQDKSIPPKGNTSFSVVLLARAEGAVSSSLYIHSSEGTFRYQVAGTGITSPYRLKPLGGLRLPLNAIFQPLVWLHNPHQYSIQVVEVYSSGSDLHLELPGGEVEGPKALWEVPPFCTKPVIRARFEAVSQNNHTAYIRMKLKHSEEVLVVPVELEVTDQGGVYPSVPLLDFGLGGTAYPPHTIQLQLSNSLKRAVRVLAVGMVTPNRAVTITLPEPVKVLPGAEPITVAYLTYNWKVGFDTKQTSGQIWVKTRGSNSKLIIPYTATPLEGGIICNPAATHLFISDLHKLPKTVAVTNQFRIPVAINNVTLMDGSTNVFQIKGFEPIILGAGKTAGLMSLALRDGCRGPCSEQLVDSNLLLTTNVSDVIIPLKTYNGRLSLIFPHDGAEPGVIDLGLLSAGTEHTFRFGLLNHNPVPMELRAVTTSSLLMRPRVLGIFKGNATGFKKSYLYGNVTEGRLIMPGRVGVVQLTAEATNVERTFTGELAVSTTHDVFMIPVKASIAFGALEMVPKDLLLEDCFPGKICRHQLKVQSSFNRPMTAVGVTTVPPDARLTFKGSPGGSDILPSTSNYIGELTWEPWRGCGSACYLGLPLNSTGGSHWVYSAVLPPTTADSDSVLLRERYQRLANMTNGGSAEHWEDITLRLHTNELREQLFQARVRLTWPKLANTTKLVFPLTQVTNTTFLRLKLYNPASHLILVQLVMEWAYPHPKRLVDSFPTSFRPLCGSDCFHSSPKEFFIFQDFSGSAEPSGVLNTTLAPGESYEITIGYNAQNAGLSRSLLLIRNNLTVIEALELEGKAAFAQLKFGNRRPGAENPLLFEIADKHLRDCQRERNKKFPSPNLTVKRSFTARNVGDLPIYVHGFAISGLECEGYGFAVLNCAPFLLMPNATRKIDIAFTPDFTLSKVTRTLRLETTLGTDVNYTMVTTLPPYFLASCAAVLGRPSWEPLLYYSSVSFMLFLLFCVLAAAFFESDRILKCALLTLTRERTLTPLDLRQVGAGVLKELANQRKSDTVMMESMEKYKLKDPTPITVSDSPGWITGSFADDRQFEQSQKESLSSSKTDDHDKDSGPKSKKKLGKRNSDADAQEVAAISKRKDKNTANGWCNVFNRNVVTEKAKPKSPPLETPPPEPVKPVKPIPEPKKEEVKKEEKEKRRGKTKRNKEVEEDTSSNMTDSSNDTEKETKDCKEGKEEKKPRNSKGKGKEENNDENKSVHSRTIWRMSGKSGKGPLTENGSIWKQSEAEMEPLRTIEISKSRGKNNNVRDRKDKNSVRRLTENHLTNDQGLQNSVEMPCPPAPPSCWDQRSFSDVVSSDSPLLYSYIVQAKPSSSHMFAEDKPEPSAPLGPIGSKKPTPSWGSPALSTPKTFDYPPPGYIDLQSEPDILLDSEDALPLDPVDRWEDQHALMQMMHTTAQPSWKEVPEYESEICPHNFLKKTQPDLTAEQWSDSVWSPGRNEVNGDVNGCVEESSWGALIRASWSPLQWAPRPSPPIHHHLLQQPEYPPPGYGTEPILFSQPPPPVEERENGAPFDPFHSSIWSPKAPNAWAAPGTQ